MSKDIIFVTSSNEPDVKKTIRGQKNRNSGISPVDWTYLRTVSDRMDVILYHY
jgi:hypothetical protein